MSSLQAMLESVQKEKFKNAANKLLNECFILRRHKDTSAEYAFIINNRELFSEYFSYLGYELALHEEYGVIALNNPSGTGRIHLSKMESTILLLLRLLYIERRKSVTQAEDVVITMDELVDRYRLLNMPVRFDKTNRRNIIAKFRRWHIVQNLDSDPADVECRIVIYPSVFLAIRMEDLNAVYELAKERLEQYKSRAGEEEDYEFDE